MTIYPIAALSTSLIVFRTLDFWSVVKSASYAVKRNLPALITSSLVSFLVGITVVGLVFVIPVVSYLPYHIYRKIFESSTPVDAPPAVIPG